MQTLHTTKLAAVDEVIEQLNGQPLIVAYWFKHDLQALQRHYPDAVVLPRNAVKQLEVMAAWNAGKIPLLLLNPGSAGHGLSLQHGGNHMFIYTIDWNAELYEQVIERIGPTRQAQSGYKRPVYIYRCIARRTWEHAVAMRLTEKLTTTEMVKRALGITREG